MLLARVRQNAWQRGAPEFQPAEKTEFSEE